MRANPLNTTSARTWSGWKQGRSAPRWLCRGVIGTGNMGRGIATRALAGNHSVTLLGTETSRAEALAAELSGDVRAGQVGDPLAGDVVVLAVWYGAVDDILNRYGDQLNGKVVDIANPIDVDALSRSGSKRGRPRRRSPPGLPVRRSSRPSTPRSRAPWATAGSQAYPSTSSSPPTPTTQRRPSAGSSPTPACARSTPARSGAPESSRRLATSTWRCSSRSARASPARGRFSPSAPRPGPYHPR